MKINTVLSFLAFTCFLVIGYTYSTRFYQPGEPLSEASAKIVTTQVSHPIATMDNGQRSFLLIGVNKLTKDTPRLKSIWLATYVPNGNSIQLFPVFPSEDQTSSGFETQLEQAFTLNHNGQSLELSQSFIGLLEKNNYWWSGYVIFDELSIAKIMDLYGVRVKKSESQTGTSLMQLFRDGRSDPILSYSSQVAVFQSLCHEFAKGDSILNVPQLPHLVTDYIVTDLDTSQLEQELDSLSAGGHAPACRFPTLEISRIEP